MPKTIRENWGKARKTLPEINLSQIQVDSYQDFLLNGIKTSLLELNPIRDFTGKFFQLEFRDHHIGKPKLSPREAMEKGVNFEAPLKVTARLTNLQTKAVQEQEIFLGDIPLMTTVGTFIINGVERVVVNQLVRSPGVFYTRELDPNSGRYLFRAEIRPLSRGSWLEFIVSRNDHISVRIDRHRKISATALIRALGYDTNEQILELFEDVDTDKDHKYIHSTLLKDSTKNQNEALLEFYDKIRPGEPAVVDNAKNLFHQMFFDKRRYDLGLVGRYKLNKKLSVSLPIDEDHVTLAKEDIIASIRYLIKLQNGQGKTDDIDHLANRRVRRVGELVNQTAFRVGLLRLERSIKEKMSMAKAEDLPTPSALINPRPIIASVYEFFRRNRLSSILEQVNPLSEIDNLRRLSVMGTGGVTRERASFPMRDINASQYSRICPVRSPEGQNIGLVTYLALYTRINEFGFLEAPYFRVVKEEKNGEVKMRITDEIVYLTADDEENYYVTHAEVGIKDNYLTDKWVAARYNSQFLEVDITSIQFIDVVPRQVLGTSASLIPFVQHDDGTRALMGSHMQTQAVPLLKPESPIVGTGMEDVIAQSMGWVVKARHAGEVVSSDAKHVSIKLSSDDAKQALKEQLDVEYGFVTLKGDVETYHVRKYHRTSQSTSYNQHPIVTPGTKVKVGDIIINGPAAENGELAIGQNLLIAYGSFEGLGYEDAIVISSRLLEEDLLTSIHINEYVADVMDTKLGREELTGDIPNVAETDLRNLGVDGIVSIGANVSPNDILVGKIAPKGETELTAEERLLRAIFGEKAREVRDTSLRMPHGEQGTVISVQILDRDQGDELEAGVIQQIKVRVAQLRKITVGDKLAGRHGNKGVISKIVPKADMPYLEDGRPIDIMISPLSVIARMNLGQLMEAQLGLAAASLGKQVAVPVFEKIEEENIANLLTKAGWSTDSKAQLFDGRTGEPFHNKTAIGVAYILKLIHMVEDKTHARSTGPYSLVTQQPLGGKAQMGGQRLGEMEVWAFEAHKAAHALQEMLTIKSDDVVGRSKAFEAIVKGLPIPESTVPESFKVLVKELNSLGLNIIPTGPVIKEEVKEDEVTISDPSSTIVNDINLADDDDDDDDDEDEETKEPEESAVTNQE